MSGGRTSPLSLGFERGSFARIDVRTQIMPADLGGRFQRENMLRRSIFSSSSHFQTAAWDTFRSRAVADWPPICSTATLRAVGAWSTDMGVSYSASCNQVNSHSSLGHYHFRCRLAS